MNGIQKTKSSFFGIESGFCYPFYTLLFFVFLQGLSVLLVKKRDASLLYRA